MTRARAVREINHILDEYDYYLDEMEKEALNMAIKALEQEPIIRCEDCKHHGTSNCPYVGR